MLTHPSEAGRDCHARFADQHREAADLDGNRPATAPVCRRSSWLGRPIQTPYQAERNARFTSAIRFSSRL